jgi:hypothetical protein
MSQLLITHARVFDGTNPDCPEGMNVLVADGLIREVRSASRRRTRASSMPAAAP